MVDVDDVIYGAGGWEYAICAAVIVGCGGEGIRVSSGGHVQGVMDGDAVDCSRDATPEGEIGHVVDRDKTGRQIVQFA